jgi:hypothetical protein
VFDDMHEGRFVKTMINSADDDDKSLKRIKGGPDGQDSDDEDDLDAEATAAKEKQMRRHDNGVRVALTLNLLSRLSTHHHRSSVSSSLSLV